MRHLPILAFLALVSLFMAGGCGGAGGGASSGGATSTTTTTGGGTTTAGGWNGVGGNSLGNHRGVGPGARGVIAWKVSDTAVPFAVTSTGQVLAGRPSSAGVATKTLSLSPLDGSTTWTATTPVQFGLIDGNGDLLMGIQKLRTATGAVILQNANANDQPTPVGITPSGTIYARSGVPAATLKSYTINPVDLSLNNADVPFINPSTNSNGLAVANISNGTNQVDGSVQLLGWAMVLTLTGGTVNRPSFGNDMTVYAIASDRQFVTLASIQSEVGIANWRVHLTPATTSANTARPSEIAVSATTGNLFFSLANTKVGPDGGQFYAVSPLDGSVVWSKDINNQALVNPLIASDGTVYTYQSSTKSLVALNQNGAVFWSVVIGDNPTQLIQAADGTLYINAGGNILAIK